MEYLPILDWITLLVDWLDPLAPIAPIAGGVLAVLTALIRLAVALVERRRRWTALHECRQLCSGAGPLGGLLVGYQEDRNGK